MRDTSCFATRLAQNMMLTKYMAELGVAMVEELIDAVKTSSSYNGSCKPWKNPEVSNESVSV